PCPLVPPDNVVPETSYSSSEDEDFFDADDFPGATPSQSPSLPFPGLPAHPPACQLILGLQLIPRPASAQACQLILRPASSSLPASSPACQFIPACQLIPRLPAHPRPASSSSGLPAHPPGLLSHLPQPGLPAHPPACQLCQLISRPASSSPGSASSYSGLPAHYLACQLISRPASSYSGLPAHIPACQLIIWPASSSPGLPAHPRGQPSLTRWSILQ
ncbi:vegetative cell wall protein gp1-like, partial [Homarus americanus]|uniref:vegetative cell wall protein gp1-like n=1 Tax=Homarus americanus TaxID=6706 RepID=UPI001C45A783